MIGGGLSMQTEENFAVIPCTIRAKSCVKRNQ